MGTYSTKDSTAIRKVEPEYFARPYRTNSKSTVNAPRWALRVEDKNQL